MARKRTEAARPAKWVERRFTRRGQTRTTDGQAIRHDGDPQPAVSPQSGAPRRVLIVGGVGGASCVARLRRLDESVEIVVFERGPYVSFANCGLPYYVGNVIPEERLLLVASPAMFRVRFNVDVQTETEVTAIDRSARTITVREGHTGISRVERYDVLVLAPGTARASRASRRSTCIRGITPAITPARVGFILSSCSRCPTAAFSAHKRSASKAWRSGPT